MLVDAGRGPLPPATSLPARHVGLADRHAIAPGLRADLVLPTGGPPADITPTCAISRVWGAGVEVPAAREGTTPAD